MKDKIKKTMSNVFDIPEDSILEETSPHDIENWDSLTHMNLISALEEEFNLSFDDDEVETLINFKVICATVEAHKEN